ncbi:unnamed protein product [Meganyctiphanes norvegica]|uniref:Uncharacterized protein n=1 Tax=Meganyctiphanes norvegica TaxID=48144 RepID=A0AAV2RQB3_MEGNR
MAHTAVLLVLLSALSSCYGEADAEPDSLYKAPPVYCKPTVIEKYSTIIVTDTVTRHPVTNTTVREAETVFNALPPAWVTSVTTTWVEVPPHTTTVHVHGYPCEKRLYDVQITNTIPVFTTTTLEPYTVTKTEKLIKWKTLEPITKTVLSTVTEVPDFKVKLQVYTDLYTTEVTADPIVMTVPVTITDVVPGAVSTVRDTRVIRSTIPAKTIKLPGSTYMKPPATHTSTVIITHTTVVAADTKLATWTVTQKVNKKCKETYYYNTPTVHFTEGLYAPTH